MYNIYQLKLKNYLFSAKTGGENSRGHELAYDEGRKEGKDRKKRERARKKESLAT